MDEFTPNLNLPLPVRENQLRDDVGRLRDAFGIIDAAVSTKADLVDGKVPSSQLPSYVDDVLEYANFAGFPATGEAGKIYVAIDTSKVYRWGGSAYAVISDFVFLPATPTTLGGVKVGSGLGIDPDGVLYVVGGGGGSGLPVYGDQSIAPASNGQTVFTVTGGYNPGQLDVWLNGVMLVGNGDDYTASNGTTFALTVGANTTDLLLVRKWIYLPEAQAVAKTGDTMTGALNWAAATTVASATTTNIGLATSNNVTITGTTAITSFGSYAAGAVRTVTFAGALTLTHNALSLILPGGANITTAANDVAVFVSLGAGNWRCTGYQKANGQSVIAPNVNQATARWVSAPIAANTSLNDGSASVEVRNNGGFGDGNVAALAFHCVGHYATKMYLRADGCFGIGGWSRAAWSWYVDGSSNMVAAGNVSAYSDPRLKENFKRVVNPLSILAKLDGGTFTWKHGIPHIEAKAGKRDYGILADQVEAVMPEVVSQSIDIEGESYRVVSYEKLVPVLIEAVKELEARVKTLEGR